jgi:hypothetical protein
MFNKPITMSEYFELIEKVANDFQVDIYSSLSKEYLIERYNFFNSIERIVHIRNWIMTYVAKQCVVLTPSYKSRFEYAKMEHERKRAKIQDPYTSKGLQPPPCMAFSPNTACDSITKAIMTSKGYDWYGEKYLDM